MKERMNQNDSEKINNMSRLDSVTLTRRVRTRTRRSTRR